MPNQTKPQQQNQQNQPIKAISGNRRRRNRPRRKRRQPVISEIVPVQNSSVTRDPFAVRYASRRPLRRRNFLSRTGQGALTEKSCAFVTQHLDPCGEYATDVFDSRVPDGAVPFSTALGAREAFVVKVPGGLQSEVPLTGAQWCLTLLHLPLLRYPMVLVANTDNAEMSPEDRREVFRALNAIPNEAAPLYPTDRKSVV